MYKLLYRNINLLVLILILIFVWGIGAFFTTPFREDPFLRLWYGLVTTYYPGANAEQVETLVTQKLETNLLEIPEIKSINSVSRTGVSTVIIELGDKVSNLENTWTLIRDKISDAEAQLPDEASKPEFENIQSNAFNLVIELQSNSQDTDSKLIELSRIANTLEERIQNVDGIEKIEFFGQPDEEFIVEVDSALISELGITIEQLSQKIAASDAKIASGQFRGKENDLLIELASNLTSLEDIENIPIISATTGQVTRVKDIATVVKGIKKPSLDTAIIKGKSAIVLGILANSQQQISQWNQKVRQVCTNFQKQLPSDISLNIIFDQSKYVETRISSLLLNLFIGGILVVFIALILMGWQPALVVGVSLPLTTLMVFGLMNVLNITFHQMSLTGLLMSLGLLIDNPIVMVDEIGNSETELPKLKAIEKSIKFLKIPLLASTITTILTFIPIVFLPGIIGEFVSDIGKSVILALLSSLLLTLTVIPVLTARINQSKENLSWWQRGIANNKLKILYCQLLDKSLERPLWGIFIALILPLAGFIGGITLQEQFFPPADRDMLEVEMELPTQASISQTQKIALEARNIIINYPQVDEVHWFLGRYAPSFYYNTNRWRKAFPNYAHGIIQLHSHEESRDLTQKLQQELDLALPDARILVEQFEQGQYVYAPIELRILGSQFEELEKLGKQIRLELTKMPEINHVRSSFVSSVPKLNIDINEEKALSIQLDRSTIAQQLSNYLEGSTGGIIIESQEDIPIRVRLSNQQRSEINSISSLNLLTEKSFENNSTIPLSALGEINLTPEIGSITRYNGRRVNTIQAFADAGAFPSQIQSTFMKRLKHGNFELPSGYELEEGGQAEARNTAIRNLALYVPFSLIAAIAVLVWSFESFIYGGVIAIVALAAIGLGLGSLKLLNYPLGFMAILGIVGLIGIAINDSIVVLSALKSDEMALQGNPLAIRNVVMRSTRHVLTTTLTTIAGFVPLFWEQGEFWTPLVAAIAGGISGTTLIGLLFVPCIFFLTVKYENKKS